MAIPRAYGWSAAGVMAVGWVLVTCALSPLILEDLELRVFDLFQRLEGIDEAKRDDIVLVNVDDATISAFGWPVPRIVWALWLNNLNEFGPRQIGFDLFLTHHLCDPAEDTLLAATMRDSRPVILAVGLALPEEQNYHEIVVLDSADLSLVSPWPQREGLAFDSRILHSDVVTERPLPVLLDSAWGAANVALDPDGDGVIRRVPLFTEFADRLAPNFALSLFLQRRGIGLGELTLIPGMELIIPGTAPIRLDSKSRMILDYVGGPGSFLTFSFVELLDLLDRALSDGDEKAMEALRSIRGATVILGVTDPSLMDLPATPVHPRFPGPEIQATVLDNLLRGTHITRTGWKVELLLAFLLSLLASAVGLRLRPATGAAVVIVVAVVFLVAVFLLGTQHNLWVGSVAALVAVAGSYGASVTLERLAREKEQRLVKDAFGKYVSPAVLKELLHDPSSVLSGAGQKKDITIIFSDVKGFSRLCEEHEATALLTQLNEYLSEMTEIVFMHGGTVDKFMGDGLMAFFGHPAILDDHAARAVRAAVEMQRRLGELRKRWEEEGRLQFRIRVGVNSGQVIAGSMGGAGKMDYTVFGRSVNLAQRLEAGCDTDGVLVSERTLLEAGLETDQAQAKTIHAKNIGEVTAFQLPMGVP